MDRAQIEQFEQLCTEFYTTSEGARRQEAEQALNAFANSATCLQACESVLQHSHSPFALQVVASTITQHISVSREPIESGALLSIRTYALRYLAEHADLPGFVATALVHLVCRVTKLGWLRELPTSADGDAGSDRKSFRAIVDEVAAALESNSAEHMIVGARVLAQLVQEMNVSQPLTSSKHRRVAVDFRDSCLEGLYSRSIATLQRLTEGTLSLATEAQRERLQAELLELSEACLTFDFVGTQSEDAAADSGSVHIPGSWRAAVMMSFELFFKVYMAARPPASAKALSCLSQLVAIRRSLYQEDERNTVLAWVLRCIRGILVSGHGLEEVENYHEFCRLLGRLKINFNLPSLVKVEGWEELVDLLARFAISSMQLWQWSPNSAHYVLSLWQSLAAGVPFLRSTSSFVERYCPEIADMYIAVRAAASDAAEGGVEDPLDDPEALAVELGMFAGIARCDYSKSAARVIGLMDPLVAQYRQLTAAAGAEGAAGNAQRKGGRELVEAKLAWLLYMTGALVCSRSQVKQTDDDDELDGELSCRALTVAQAAEQAAGRGAACGERVEQALLYFLHAFKSTHIVDSSSAPSRAYVPLEEKLHISSQSDMLRVIVHKVLANFKMWPLNDRIVRETMRLWTDLSVGYSSGRMLAKIDVVQYLIEQHRPSEFPFLEAAADQRLRTDFYAGITRILTGGTWDEDARLEQFLSPFQHVLVSLEGEHARAGDAAFRTPEARRALAGLARDLRGIAASCAKRVYFMAFHEWVFPRYTPVLARGLEVWAHDPAVAVPLLKFFSELCANRSERLLFANTNANGVLLVREMSGLLSTYADRVLAMSVSAEQAYSHRYKGIGVCFGLLRFILAGGYVNFGVFGVYQDPALDLMLATLVRLAAACPTQDLLAYPKVSSGFYNVLESVMADHVGFLARLDPDAFGVLIRHMVGGIQQGESGIQSQACTALDSLLTHQVVAVTRGRGAEQAGAIARLLAAFPSVLPDLQATLFHRIVYEECANQWSLARPLLGLILLAEKVFMQLREHMIASAPPQAREELRRRFDELMRDVQPTLTQRNRDRFYENMTAFRNAVLEMGTGGSSAAAQSLARGQLNSVDMAA